MKRHIQVSRNLRVIYSSKSILAADKIGGREHAEQIASDLLDLFKSHVSKISNKIELKTDVEVTTDNTWKIDLLILYPGAEWWDNSRQASDYIWVYYDQNEDSIYMYYTEIDNPSFRRGVQGKFHHVQNCESVYDLPLDWDIIEENIQFRFQDIEARKMKQTALPKASLMKELNKILRDHGVATTPRARYKLIWHVSDHGGEYGDRREVTYTANGDWIAAFGLRLKSAPTAKKIADDMGPDFAEIIESYASEYPTASELIDAMGWEWASPDEYTWVESLTNLTTGEVLYKADVNPEDFSDYE